MRKIMRGQLMKDRERSGQVAQRFGPVSPRTRARNSEEGRMLAKATQTRAAKGYPYKFD